MVQTTWNVKLRRAEVLNMSWSGAAVVAGELLDKHGYQYTFCIAAGLSAVALACSRLSSFSQNSRDFHSNLSKFRPMQMLQNLKDSKVELQKRWWLWWIHSPLEDFWQQSCWAKAVPLSRCGPRNPISGITMLGSHWASLSTLWHNAPSWRAKDCETSSKNGKAVKHVWDLELTRILQYFTLTRCIHAGFGAILPCFPQDYPKIFDPRQLLAELDEEPTVQATAARLREAWLSFWTAGILLGPGLRCRHASWFLGDRNFSTFSIRGASPLQLGESALENNSCFGSPISRIWVLSNPDTNKTCSNSLGTPDTFGLVSWISRFSMEMGIDGSQC